MKKKIIIPIIIVLLIGILVIGCFLVSQKNITIITLDINPSIELKVTKKEKVKSMIAINEEAKEIIKDLKGKKLEEALVIMVDRVIEKGYPYDNQVTIILYSNGIRPQEIEHRMQERFNEKGIHAEIIIIESITQEDEKLAKIYKISPAKMSYIQSVINDNKELTVDKLLKKSIRELKETKERGVYCDDGYTLEGDFCTKEIGRENATPGMVCPREYYDYQGTCYEEKGSIETDNLICHNESELKDGKCIRIRKMEAIAEYTCEKGELKTEQEIHLHDWKGGPACVDSSKGQAPTLRCLLQPHMMIDGKCYVGPAPTIGGGCPGNDVLSEGGCYSLDPEDQWQCPDGSIYEKSKGSYVDICPDTLTYTDPILKGYHCENGYTLKDNECIQEETEDPEKERICPSGYFRTEEGRCINLNNTKVKEDGYICTKENSRVEGSTCVILDMKEANHIEGR